MNNSNNIFEKKNIFSYDVDKEDNSGKFNNIAVHNYYTQFYSKDPNFCKIRTLEPLQTNNKELLSRWYRYKKLLESKQILVNKTREILDNFRKKGLAPIEHKFSFLSLNKLSLESGYEDVDHNGNSILSNISVECFILSELYKNSLNNIKCDKYIKSTIKNRKHTKKLYNKNIKKSLKTSVSVIGNFFDHVEGEISVNPANKILAGGSAGGGFVVEEKFFITGSLIEFVFIKELLELIEDKNEEGYPSQTSSDLRFYKENKIKKLQKRLGIDEYGSFAFLDINPVFYNETTTSKTDLYGNSYGILTNDNVDEYIKPLNKPVNSYRLGIASQDYVVSYYKGNTYYREYKESDLRNMLVSFIKGFLLSIISLSKLKHKNITINTLGAGAGVFGGSVNTSYLIQHIAFTISTRIFYNIYNSINYNKKYVPDNISLKMHVYDDNTADNIYRYNDDSMFEYNNIRFKKGDIIGEKCEEIVNKCESINNIVNYIYELTQHLDTFQTKASKNKF